MRRRIKHVTPIRSGRSDGTGWVVTAALFTPLVLLLIVAGMTWRSERRVAAVTDRVVHDYAAIAVWQYVRRANTLLHEEVMHAFSEPGSPGHQRANARTAVEPASALLAHRGASASTFHQRARIAFSYDPVTERLDAAGDTIGTRTRAMLRRRLRVVAGTTRSGDEPHRVLFDSADGRSHAIALWVISGGAEVKAVVKGIVTDADVLQPVFARALREPNLLPAVAGSGERSRDGLALRLARADGAVVFATDRQPGKTAATDTTGLQSGELRATLDLPSELAQELLIGGGPGSQLPSLGLMILAAAVLAVIGLVHHSRSRALAQARTRFVANASHELRTPLAQISMFAETLHLGRERNEAERRQFAGIVFAEARRLTALVENVLRFSRAEHAEPALRPHPHRVGKLIASAVRTFAPVALAAEAHIEVGASDGVCAHVDAAAFQQIMLNLLDNAVKHGGKRVQVAAGVLGDAVRVIVDDDGPGVPVEWRSRVFEPFAQVGGRNIAGAGIGLAIVRDLTLAHGGNVTIEDSPLGGTRVILVLRHAARPAATVGTRPAPVVA